MEVPEVVESKEVFEGRNFKLLVEVLCYEGKKFRREIIKHPGAVAVLAITKEGKLVLERQYRHPIGKWIWEIPAGTLKEGESPEDCAIREVKEETGYGVESIERLGGCYMAPGYSSEYLHIFLARLGERGESSREVGEMITISEFTLEEVREMIKRGEIEDAKTLVALFLFDEVSPLQTYSRNI